MFPFLLVATWRVFHALMRRHKLLWYLLSFPAIVVAVVAAAAAPSQIVVEQRQFVYLIHLPRCLGSLPPSASSSVVGISFFVRVKQSSAWQVSGTVRSSQFAVPRADSSPTASETLATPSHTPALSTHLSLWHLQNLTLHFAHNSQQQQRQQQ